MSQLVIAATDRCRSLGYLATPIGFFYRFIVETRRWFLVVFKGKT